MNRQVVAPLYEPPVSRWTPQSTGRSGCPCRLCRTRCSAGPLWAPPPSTRRCACGRKAARRSARRPSGRSRSLGPVGLEEPKVFRLCVWNIHRFSLRFRTWVERLLKLQRVDDAQRKPDALRLDLLAVEPVRLDRFVDVVVVVVRRHRTCRNDGAGGGSWRRRSRMNMWGRRLRNKKDLFRSGFVQKFKHFSRIFKASFQTFSVKTKTVSVISIITAINNFALWVFLHFTAGTS